jgi:hypothetical protein
VNLKSHECCPYLDGYEPDYISQAAVAVGVEASEYSDKELTWDPTEAQCQSYVRGARKKTWPGGYQPHAPNREGENAMWEGYTSDSTCSDTDTDAEDEEDIAAER